MKPDILLQVLIQAVTIGSLYGLVAISFNIIARPTGVLNFAQGDLVLIGGALTYFLLEIQSWPWVVVPVVILLGGVAVGLVEERIAIWPVLRKSPNSHGWVLSTLAISIAAENLIGLTLGDQPVAVRSPGFLSVRTRHLIGDARISSYQVAVCLFCWLIAILVYLFYRSRHGRAILALAEDRDAALLRGVRASRMVVFSFGMGSAVAALAGMAAAPLTFVVPTLSSVFLLKGFEAAAIGGIGDNRGGMVGGLIIGAGEAFAGQLLPSGYSDATTFALFLGILLIRPLGLFGKATLRQV